MARGQYPSALFWVDLEATGLPDGNDFSDVHILEVGAVITDFNLTKFTGYDDYVKLTPEHVAALKKSPEVVEMHTTSGLIEDCAKTGTKTVADIEQELIELMKECSLSKGDFIIAGSGVAAYDFPLIKEKMPELASWLKYYSIDVGILRRTLHFLGNGKQFVRGVRESHKTGHKKHRAFSDILAHLEEAEQYRDWLKEI